jgi:hypothetical protein
MITSFIVFYYNIKKAPILEEKNINSIKSDTIKSDTIKIIIFKLSNSSKFDSNYKNLYYEYTSLYIDNNKPIIPQCITDEFSIVPDDIILAKGIYYKYIYTTDKLHPINIVYAGKYIKPLTLIDNYPTLN